MDKRCLMRSVILVIVFVILLILLTNFAYGQDETEFGTYAGVKTGNWKTGNFNSSSTGLFVGYKFNPYLAAELDYLFNTRASSDNDDGSISVDSNSYILALRPILPLNKNWELFAKLGWEYYRYNLTVINHDGSSANYSGENSEFSQGIGIAWNKDNYHFRTEVQSDESFDFRIYSVGFGYNF